MCSLLESRSLREKRKRGKEKDVRKGSMIRTSPEDGGLCKPRRRHVAIDEDEKSACYQAYDPLC